MSRDFSRKNYYGRDGDRPGQDSRDWQPNDYRYEKRRSMSRKRSRSPPPRNIDKRRSRSPRKSEKDLLDENILSEISKLPEPSELWDNQMQEGGFAGPPPQQFNPEGTYAGNYQPSYSGIYDDFPPLASMPGGPSHPPDMASWNQMSLPPPPAPMYNIEDQIKKEAAIETEMRHQKAALSKQREDYIKKAGILKKELDTLKDQRNELRGDSKRSPSPDTKRFLKENTKLQLEIQNKLKTINNVVDMLNGIIGEEAHETVDSDDSTDRSTKRKSRSPSASKKFNYVYYDPEMHWCRVCNEFPPTAKEYLNHLHSPAHHKMAAAHMEAPWHSVSGVNEGFPSFPSAPTKRTPIRGLQFFVPSTAWYCKLCDQFIGDLHCASAHLKSVTHSKNYTNFVEQNPHWETDWMSDRQKAFEKARGKAKEDKPQYAATTITFSKDGFTTRAISPRKSKKKRRCSSSSSSSDSEPKKKKKKSKKSKSKYSSDDKLSEWMSSIKVDRLNENDRKLLDNIKTRISLDKPAGGRRSEQREARRDREERHESRSREERHESRSRDERREETRRREERDDRRDERDERREERDDRRDDRREERDDRREDRDVRREERRKEKERQGDLRDEIIASARQDAKKLDIRKMPFIGKMPVYKNLSKNSKAEDLKKDDQKKKEDAEVSKKRREEMDAEIQKKVAEFKEKIAKAQLERQQAELAPPLLLPALPLQHPFLPHVPPPQPPPPATSAPPPTLPKDFQDALDIIFPSAEKTAELAAAAQQELFPGIPGLPPPGFPVGMGGVMPPFPQLSILGQPPPHLMMGFDMNASLFQPRPQLYDTHVPLVPSPKPRQNKNRQNHNNNKNNQTKKDENKNAASNTTTSQTQSATTTTATTAPTQTSTKPATKNKEELDDLALLGIDANDVGAG